MKRKLIAQLENWRDSLQKKPLILSGAKGTGKTYLALAFANTYYDSYTYLNFENNPVNLENGLQAGKDDLAAFFTCILTKDRKKLPLCEVPLTGSHIFLLDEIAYCGSFESLMEGLKKRFPEADILAISSSEPDSIGKSLGRKDYQQLILHPLDFEEFLMATGNDWYIEVIKEQYRNGIVIPDIVHKELLELLEEYLYVGGLPLAVNEYVSTGGKENITEIHKNILSSCLFEAGIQKGDSCGLKVKQILYSLPKQLSKRNKKFQYSLLRKGATEGLYLEGHSYLNNAYLGIYNIKITEEELEASRVVPGTLYQNTGMRMYLFDVGLYHSLSRIAGTDKGEDFRSGLLESYAAQALQAAGIEFGYWESPSMLYSLFLLKDRKVSEGIFEEVSRGISGKSSRGGSGESFRGISEETSRELSEETSRGILEESSRGISEETSRGILEESSRGISEETSRGILGETSGEISGKILPGYVTSTDSTEKVLPLEIREAGDNRSKSLSSFHEKHPGVSCAVKVSSGNKAKTSKEMDSNKIDLPLYCMFCLGL